MDEPVMLHRSNLWTPAILKTAASVRMFSGAVLAVVLVIALLFNFHVFGLGEVETPASQPNYGNAAPCAVKGLPLETQMNLRKC